MADFHAGVAQTPAVETRAHPSFIFPFDQFCWLIPHALRICDLDSKAGGHILLLPLWLQTSCCRAQKKDGAHDVTLLTDSCCGAGTITAPIAKLEHR